MSDFAQTGLICTLQRLGDQHLSIVEGELVELSHTRPIALVLPCHANDLGRPAFATVWRELARSRFLARVVLSMNGLAPDQLARHCCVAIDEAVGSARVSCLFNPEGVGKGGNVAAAFAHLQASGHTGIVATQDCDVASFRSGSGPAVLRGRASATRLSLCEDVLFARHGSTLRKGEPTFPRAPPACAREGYGHVPLVISCSASAIRWPAKWR